MRRPNGSVIGPKVITSAVSAVGLWSTGEMAMLQSMGDTYFQSGLVAAAKAGKIGQP